MAWVSLVSYLPALEDVTLRLTWPLVKDDLGCLLEALARCPCLRALDLCTGENHGTDAVDADLHWPFPDAAAFAKLRSLTKLALSFDEEDQFFPNWWTGLAGVVSALAPLTALAELSLSSNQWAVVPAALGQFKGLRSLALRRFTSLRLEAGCLDLPNLLSLEFEECYFWEGAVLPGVSALQRLTRVELSSVRGHCFFYSGLVHIPLQRLVLSHLPYDFDPGSIDDDDPYDISQGSPRLPADMGLLSLSLLQLDVCAFVLSRFPLAFTQLVALERLDASYNEFTVLPAGITALSRLTELRLGRCPGLHEWCEHEILDARALGDLSGFPALRNLTFDECQVMLCPSLLGAVRHASLTSFHFYCAYPAPECAPMVLQLSRELGHLRRSRPELWYRCGSCGWGAARGLTSCQKFGADLNACGL